MNKRMISFCAAGLIAASFWLGSVPVYAETSSSSAVEFAGPQSASEFYQALSGTWEGTFHVVTSQTVSQKADGSTSTSRTYIDDKVVMNFVNGKSKPRMYLTVESCPANYLTPRKFSVNEENNLVFVFNDEPWQATVTLHFTSPTQLDGTYLQYGKSYPIQFRRTSATPVNMGADAQFTFESMPSVDWFQKLTAFPTYQETGASIPYTYELGTKTPQAAQLSKQYKLDELTKGQSDVQQMETLLNLVSDTFTHDGAVELPEKHDALSLIEYAKSKKGMECRGLSIILSEMLRAVGVPAKPVMCIPANDPCEDCHVVVHAYSFSQNQWIMLDPTYQLMLKNDQGHYVSLPMLRDSLMRGEALTANSTAGRNNRPFYMDFYRAYMAKNCFRFSSATNFSYGVEFQTGLKENMLLPVGYQIPFAGYRTETLTRCAKEFWAAPPASLAPPKPAVSSSSSSTAESSSASSESEE